MAENQHDLNQHATVKMPLSLCIYSWVFFFFFFLNVGLCGSFLHIQQVSLFRFHCTYCTSVASTSQKWNWKHLLALRKKKKHNYRRKKPRENWDLFGDNWAVLEKHTCLWLRERQSGFSTSALLDIQPSLSMPIYKGMSKSSRINVIITLILV